MVSRIQTNADELVTCATVAAVLTAARFLTCALSALARRACRAGNSAPR